MLGMTPRSSLPARHTKFEERTCQGLVRIFVIFLWRLQYFVPVYELLPSSSTLFCTMQLLL